ncbi:MAG: LysM peptidoglycan-binding domain-containing protein [Solirubrobacteraceae bacterium]
MRMITDDAQTWNAYAPERGHHLWASSRYAPLELREGNIVGKIAPAAHFAAATQRRSRKPRYLALVAFAAVLGAVIVVVVSAPGGPGTHPPSVSAARSHVRRLPPYWTVRPGDTFTRIAQKTRLTVAQLQAFNPNIDPSGLVPGQRLNLWLHPPPPRPKPLGPRFWTVRAGESFGSIAAKTAINITKLEQLNPRLKPSTLQPGDRVRLRP